MKQPEEAIETILTSLGSTEATPGMEHRILQAIEDRATAQPQSPWRPWRPAASLTFASILIIALIVPVLHRQNQSPTQAKLRTTSTQAPPQPASNTVQANAPLPLSTQTAPPTRTRAAQPASSPLDNVAAAQSAMHATSFPAPPLPLTEQEKLLLKIVHRGDPAQLAMLNPAIRDQQLTEARTEFQKFFEPFAIAQNHESKSPAEAK